MPARIIGGQLLGSIRIRGSGGAPLLVEVHPHGGEGILGLLEPLDTVVGDPLGDPRRVHDPGRGTVGVEVLGPRTTGRVNGLPQLRESIVLEGPPDAIRILSNHGQTSRGVSEGGRC